MNIKIYDDIWLEIELNSIALFHEHVDRNRIGLYTTGGFFLDVEANDFWNKIETSEFEMALTRFNPSIEANKVGVDTKWEDGEQFQVYYRPSLPVIINKNMPLSYLIIGPIRFPVENLLTSC